MNDFNGLGIETLWQDKAKMLGIKTPTPIQSTSIPLILMHKDLIAQAKTGSGKTLAFLLPMFQMLQTQKRGLILVPTRELAKQITSLAEKLLCDTPYKVLSVYGGQDTQKQVKKLKTAVDVIVATPGRLMDHVSEGHIDLSEIGLWVFDEADQMLLLGFKNEMEWLLSKKSKAAQMLCFSATISPAVKKLAYKHMSNPVSCAVDTDQALKPMDQLVIKTSDRWKTLALITIMKETNPFLGIVFCRTIRRLEKLEEALRKEKINLGVLHGDLSQAVRERVLKQFRDAKFQFLLTTDVSSRGLDIQGVTHIYNYDMPETSELYLHRVGRTGRMGDQGKAITFVTAKDEAQLIEIEKTLSHAIPCEVFVKPEDHIDTTHNK